MKRFANNKGFSYILICVIVLIACMLIAVGIEYAYVLHTANAEKEDKQLVLDSMMTSYAVEKYDALKQGEAYDKYIDNSTMINKAYTVLGFGNSSTTKLTVTTGDRVYTVTRPTVSALTGDSFGVVVRYTAKIPFTVFGKQITDISVPVEIVSKYQEK